MFGYRCHYILGRNPLGCPCSFCNARSASATAAALVTPRSVTGIGDSGGVVLSSLLGGVEPVLGVRGLCGGVATPPGAAATDTAVDPPSVFLRRHSRKAKASEPPVLDVSVVCGGVISPPVVAANEGRGDILGVLCGTLVVAAECLLPVIRLNLLSRLLAASRVSRGPEVRRRLEPASCMRTNGLALTFPFI